MGEETSEQYYKCGSIDGFVAVFRFDRSLPEMYDFLKGIIDRHGLRTEDYQIDQLDPSTYGIVMRAKERVAASIANYFVFEAIPREYDRLIFRAGFGPIDNIANVRKAYKAAQQDMLKMQCGDLEEITAA